MTKLRALSRALMALAILGGLIGGVPWALLTFADQPITGVPTWEQIQDLPATALTDAALLAATSVALWAAWLLLMVTILAEVVAHLRGIDRSRVGLGGPVERVIGFLVGSIVISLAAAPAAGAAPSLPAATTDVQTGPQAAGPGEVTTVSIGLAAAPAAPEGALVEWAAYLADEDDASAGSLAGDDVITVGRDDTAWSLAERHLGDGARWREIWELNNDYVQANGSRWANADDPVEPGWRLQLPSADTGEPALAASEGVGEAEGDGDATSGPADVAPAPASEVVVGSGDHFWGIAKQQLTDAWGRTPSDVEISPYWQDLVDANRDRLLPPVDPDLIFPEQLFVLPPVPADPHAPAAAPAPAPGSADPHAPDEADSRTTTPGDDSSTAEDAPTTPGENATPAEEVPPSEEVDEEPVSSTGDEVDAGTGTAPEAAPAPPSNEAADPPGSAGDETAEDDGEVGDAVGGGEAEGERQDASAPATEGKTGAAPTSTTAVLLPDPEQASSSSDSDSESSSRALAPVGLAGGGLALAGVVLALERRRRVQQRYRARGERVAMPEEGLDQRETELRHGADVDGGILLDAALRAAAAGAGTTGLPDLRWVKLSDDGVTLMLDAPSPAPPGFRNVSADRWESTGGPDELATMGASAAPPLPALVPVGAMDDGSEVLIDLEAAGVVALDGPTDDVDGLLRATAVAAATAPWSEQTRLLLVGMDGELAQLPWVESVDRLDDAVRQAEAHAERAAASLRAVDCPTTAQARASGAMPEQWDPLIVLSAEVPDGPAMAQRLGALAMQDRSAVGVVVRASGGGVPGRTVAIGGDGSLEIAGVDVPAWPRLLAAEDAEDLVELLDVANRLDGVAPELAVEARSEAGAPPAGREADEAIEAREADEAHEPAEVLDLLQPVELDPLDDLLSDGLEEMLGNSPDPLAPADGTVRRDQPATTAGTAALVPTDDLGLLLSDVDVMVRVLGEVEAVRLSRPTGGRSSLDQSSPPEEKLMPTRQKGLEAVAYLALRESAVVREDLESALFPAGAGAAKTIYNTVSSARALVGDDLFPPVEGARYELSDRVATDYGVFCELVALADETDEAPRAADLLTSALTLVRGEPFAGVGRSYPWVGEHRSMIVAQVIDAADELGEIRLATGDWRAAEWAARQGLRAFPADERMYRLLMRTASAAGNTPGLHRVFREVGEVVTDPDIGVEPEDTLHPETVALFEELTGSLARQHAKGA